MSGLFLITDARDSLEVVLEVVDMIMLGDAAAVLSYLS